MKGKYKRNQAKCSHDYPKRVDSFLRWRCCGCDIMKWYWTYKIN